MSLLGRGTLPSDGGGCSTRLGFADASGAQPDRMARRRSPI
jgi:hypothetical protein